MPYNNPGSGIGGVVSDGLLVFNKSGSDYAALPVSGAGEVSANIIPRTDTLANLLALTGANGEIATATDAFSIVVQGLLGTFELKQLQFKVGNLPGNVITTVPQNISVTGLGFRPKAVFIFAGDATFLYGFSVGFIGFTGAAPLTACVGTSGTGAAIVSGIVNDNPISYGFDAVNFTSTAINGHTLDTDGFTVAGVVTSALTTVLNGRSIAFG